MKRHSTYFISINNKHYDVSKDIYIYIKQLENYIKYPDESELLTKHPHLHPIKNKKTTKYIGDASNDICQLECYECHKCGFHIGIDSTYIDQVLVDPEFEFECPNCHEKLVIREI